MGTARSKHSHRDCRNNVRYLASGLIVYHAAALAVVLDPKARSQAYFDGHLADILAIAVHPGGRLVATAGIGLRPAICVWDSVTLVSLHELKSAEIQKGVGFLAYSPSGQYLAGVDLGANHLLVVFSVLSRSVVCSTKLGGEQICDLAYLEEYEVGIVGVRFFKTCAVVPGAAQVRRGEVPPRSGTLLCLARAGNRTVTGASDGTVTLWEGITAMKSTQVHQRPVDALWTTENRILTGGREGTIRILDLNLESIQTIDLNQPQYESVCSSIRSLTLSPDSSTLLIGTYGSEIYELKIDSGDGVLHVSGHFAPSRSESATNEVWGLAIFPDGQQFLSGGDDGTLRLWSIAEKRQIKAIKLDSAVQVPDSAKVRCIALAPDERSIAIGCKDGTVKLLDSQSFGVKGSKKERKDEISDIKFSPDGLKLAVASYDTFIDVWTMPAFKRKSLCKGHSSFVQHLDWSVDSLYLQSSSGASELFFWDSETGNQLANGGKLLRNEPWHSLTTVIGWPLQGIYPVGSDGTEVNTVHRSAKKFGNSEYELLASGDDYGLVKVFRHPSPTKGAQFVLGRGHSSHVTSVRFAPGDNYMLSAGGDDQSVLQWRLYSR